VDGNQQNASFGRSIWYLEVSNPWGYPKSINHPKFHHFIHILGLKPVVWGITPFWEIHWWVYWDCHEPVLYVCQAV
jgi:hypothetical protein